MANYRQFQTLPIDKHARMSLYSPLSASHKTQINIFITPVIIRCSKIAHWAVVFKSTIESLRTIQSLLLLYSVVRYTAEDRKNLQRVVRAAEWVIGKTLPPLKDIYTGRLQRRASSIIKDPPYPRTLTFLPSPLWKTLQDIQVKDKQTQ